MAKSRLMLPAPCNFSRPVLPKYLRRLGFSIRIMHEPLYGRILSNISSMSPVRKTMYLPSWTIARPVSVPGSMPMYVVGVIMVEGSLWSFL